jgi:ABC-type phosphate transport system substrate-binding protein
MKKLIVIFLFAAATAIFDTPSQAQLIITSTDVKTVAISKSDLKDIFSGASSSLGNSHVTPVLLKAGSVNDQFLSMYVGKSDLAFRTGWRSLVFSGQAMMPKSFESETAMVDYVAHNPGSIGYIGKGTPHDGVKVMSIK